jgi:hypothetical protein
VPLPLKRVEHQRYVGRHIRAIGLVRLIVVRILIGQNIERAARRDFDVGRPSNGEELVPAITGRQLSGEVTPTKNKPVALIEK